MGVDTVRFKSACIKTLTLVEVDVKSSNQHEFNGVKELKDLLGVQRFSAVADFSIRNTGEKCKVDVTWYDAREAHEKRSEHRLYFKANKVMEQAEVGDNIIIGFDFQDKLSFLLIKNNGGDGKKYDSWERAKI